MRPAPALDAMPVQPALAPWYRLVADGTRTMLEHAGSVVTLEGRAAATLLPALLPLLDGTRTVEQLVAELGAVTEPAVVNALAVLARHGLLLDGPAALDADDPPGATAAALFAASTTRRTSPREARGALAAARVAVAGSGAAAEQLAALVAGAGVGDVRRRTLDRGEGCDLLVAVPAAGEAARLEQVNNACLRDGRPWLQLLPSDGRLVVVGPLFLPRLSACHACYRLRRGACSDFEEDFDAIDAMPTRAATPRALLAAAAGIAALLVVRWLAARDPSLPGRFYALETGAVLGLSHHHVLRVPRCPACGAASTPVPAPWYREAAVAG